MERASQQASAKVVRVTVNNHLGDPAKTVSNWVGMQDAHGILLISRRPTPPVGGLSQLPGGMRLFSRSNPAAVSVTASHSESRVPAGAPAKACWVPVRLITCHSNSANLYHSGAEALQLIAKEHTSHSRPEAMGRPLIRLSSSGQSFPLLTGVCQRVAAVNGRTT